MKVTKKSILENLSKAKSVSVVAHGMDTIEDIPRIKEKCLQRIKQINEANNTNYELIETDTTFSVVTLLVFKPKVERNRIGKVNVHSKDCSFQWIDSKGEVRNSFFNHKDIEPITPFEFKIQTFKAGAYFLYTIQQ